MKRGCWATCGTMLLACGLFVWSSAAGDAASQNKKSKGNTQGGINPIGGTNPGSLGQSGFPQGQVIIILVPSGNGYTAQTLPPGSPLPPGAQPFQPPNGQQVPSNIKLYIVQNVGTAGTNQRSRSQINGNGGSQGQGSGIPTTGPLPPGFQPPGGGLGNQGGALRGQGGMNGPQLPPGMQLPPG